MKIGVEVTVTTLQDCLFRHKNCFIEKGNLNKSEERRAEWKHGNEVSGDLRAAHIDRRNLFEDSVGENSRWLGFVTGKARLEDLLCGFGSLNGGLEPKSPQRLSPNRTKQEKNWKIIWLQLGSLHNRKKKRVLCNMSERFHGCVRYSGASRIVSSKLSRSWSEDYEVSCVTFAINWAGDTISINYTQERLLSSNRTYKALRGMTW